MNREKVNRILDILWSMFLFGMFFTYLCAHSYETHFESERIEQIERKAKDHWLWTRKISLEFTEFRDAHEGCVSHED